MYLRKSSLPCLSSEFGKQPITSGTKVELLKLHSHCITKPGRPVIPVHSLASLQVAPGNRRSSSVASACSVILSWRCLSAVIVQFNESQGSVELLKYFAVARCSSTKQSTTIIFEIIARVFCKIPRIK